MKHILTQSLLLCLFLRNRLNRHERLAEFRRIRNAHLRGERRQVNELFEDYYPTKQ